MTCDTKSSEAVQPYSRGRNDEVSMKASAVHRKATLRQLEARFGPYVPAPGREFPDPKPVTIHGDFPRWQEYVEARAQNEKDKRTARAALEKELLEEKERLRLKHQNERAALLRQRSWEGEIASLHLQRRLLATEHAKEREELKERIRLPRRTHRDDFPRLPDYSVWIEDPELALLWNRRRSRPPCIEPSANTTRDYVRPLKGDIRDYQGRQVGGWVVYATKTQRARNEIAFVDRARRIDIHDSTTEASVLAALQLSAEKWSRFRVTGDPAFKDMCARLAAKHGIKLANQELRASINRYRMEIEAQMSREQTAESTKLKPAPAMERGSTSSEQKPDAPKKSRGVYER